MRWIGLALVIGLLGLGLIAYMRWPLPAGLDPGDVTRLVWLILAALLVSGAGYGFQRLRFDRNRAIAGALFWTAALLFVAALYPLFR